MSMVPSMVPSSFDLAHAHSFDHAHVLLYPTLLYPLLYLPLHTFTHPARVCTRFAFPYTFTALFPTYHAYPTYRCLPPAYPPTYLPAHLPAHTTPHHHTHGLPAHYTTPPGFAFPFCRVRLPGSLPDGSSFFQFVVAFAPVRSLLLL